MSTYIILNSRNTKLKAVPSLKKCRVHQRKSPVCQTFTMPVGSQDAQRWRVPSGPTQKMAYRWGIRHILSLTKIRGRNLKWDYWVSFFFCLFKHFCIFQSLQNGHQYHFNSQEQKKQKNNTHIHTHSKSIASINPSSWSTKSNSGYLFCLNLWTWT